ncbi:hypothetical protein M951_chr3164 (nucleomorph) [Lotharella oceanica]|uniref:Uncharacterized protein n=1 Tax=Lotharella oceanica TaxID=641309 RepID=A0A060DB53_9EUKA|nr:hypothetical protein M951_chr141 [Lotharella oceanica]AIB09669.1 hypothetical protein M951_chr1190 [Lotharella oceanica]AIB09744.1 hypothetical protein M951_chr241 [Lotharella oceanica]AIB09872.1 hypothetical protein M951_chr2180 [Lotharella oceanica]AIB09947.1 hypothetical protein M951_chr341 [Lotharella oceanica]
MSGTISETSPCNTIDRLLLESGCVASQISDGGHDYFASKWHSYLEKIGTLQKKHIVLNQDEMTKFYKVSSNCGNLGTETTRRAAETLPVSIIYAPIPKSTDIDTKAHAFYAKCYLPYVAYSKNYHLLASTKEFQEL